MSPWTTSRSSGASPSPAAAAVAPAAARGGGGRGSSAGAGADRAGRRPEVRPPSRRRAEASRPKLRRSRLCARVGAHDERARAKVADGELVGLGPALRDVGAALLEDGVEDLRGRGGPRGFRSTPPERRRHPSNVAPTRAPEARAEATEPRGGCRRRHLWSDAAGDGEAEEEHRPAPLAALEEFAAPDRERPLHVLLRARRRLEGDLERLLEEHARERAYEERRRRIAASRARKKLPVARRGTARCGSVVSQRRKPSLGASAASAYRGRRGPDVSAFPGDDRATHISARRRRAPSRAPAAKRRRGAGSGSRATCPRRTRPRAATSRGRACRRPSRATCSGPRRRRTRRSRRAPCSGPRLGEEPASRARDGTAGPARRAPRATDSGRRDRPRGSRPPGRARPSARAAPRLGSAPAVVMRSVGVRASVSVS